MTDQTERPNNPGPGNYKPRADFTQSHGGGGVLIGNAKRGGEPGPVHATSAIDRKLEAKRKQMFGEVETVSGN